MEHLFDRYGFQSEMFWLEEALPANQSAFSKYVEGIESKKNRVIGSNHRNVNKRLIEFLRKNWVVPVGETKQPEKERTFKHMINERMRREKQKQSYSVLHSMLPPGTKSDKKSIIQMAAKEIEELQRFKEELERRNTDIEGALGGREREELGEGAKIKVRVANPSSGVDSMLEVLKCLKNMGSKTRAIQSNFSTHEFRALLEIESKIGAESADEVEKAVQRTLYGVERKFHFNFP